MPGAGSTIRVKATSTGAGNVLASVIALIEDAQVGLELGQLAIVLLGGWACRPYRKGRVMVNHGVTRYGILGLRRLVVSM